MKPPKMPISLLVVEDDDVDYEILERKISLERSLSNAECRLIRADCLKAAQQYLREQRVDAILLDLSIRDAAGLEGLHRLAFDNHDCPIVVLTGTDSDDLAMRALEEGAQDYLTKNAPSSTILRAVRYAIQRQHLIQELEKAKINASQGARAKSTFLAHMSHEIRTPLTSIIGFAEAAISGSLAAEEHERAFNSILRNGRHLLSVINDILDFSKIEAGKIELEIADVSLLEIMAQIEDTVLPMCNAKGLTYKVNYAWPLPKTIRTDSLRVRQILLNLVSNAIKFTKTGSVTTTVSFSSASNHLTFEIKDTGIGLTPDQCGRLFQEFVQADISTTRCHGGTGLGLVIANEFARKLHGSINVNSEYGVGSTFTATIVAESVDGTINQESSTKGCCDSTKRNILESTNSLSGKVLLVEDGPDNQEFITFVLRKAGLDVTVKENGQDGVEAALGGDFDLILMDMCMPIMDGYTATKALRQCGYSAPIVALTANAMNQDTARCKAIGCNSIVAKPFESAKLIDVISSYLRSEAKVTTTPDPNDDSQLSGLSVLYQHFVHNLPIRLRDIESACIQSKWDTLSMLSHRLKGAAGNLEVSSVADIASQIESACNVENYIAASTLILDLKSAISEVMRREGSEESFHG